MRGREGAVSVGAGQGASRMLSCRPTAAAPRHSRALALLQGPHSPMPHQPRKENECGKPSTPAPTTAVTVWKAAWCQLAVGGGGEGAGWEQAGSRGWRRSGAALQAGAAPQARSALAKGSMPRRRRRRRRRE